MDVIISKSQLLEISPAGVRCGESLGSTRMSGQGLWGSRWEGTTMKEGPRQPSGLQGVKSVSGL